MKPLVRVGPGLVDPCWVGGLAFGKTLQSVIRPDQTRDYLIRMLDVYRLRMTRGVGQHLMRTWPTSY